MVQLARGKSAKPRVATNALMIDASSEDTSEPSPKPRIGTSERCLSKRPFPLTTRDEKRLRNETRCFRSNAGLVARRDPRMNQEEPRGNENADERL